MFSKEPKNPIRCPFCQDILGKQGLYTHASKQHKNSPAYDSWDYNGYIEANKVAQKDLLHPLRLEWRRLHGIPEDRFPDWSRK